MSDGRPGPGATLAAVLFAALFPTFATWLYFVVLPGSRWTLAVYAVCKALQFSFPMVWVVFVERSDPRLLRRPSRSALLGGLLSGVGLVAFLLIVWETFLAGGPIEARVAATTETKLAAFGVETVAGYFLLGFFYTVLHSLLEEYYWRWFVFGHLRRSLPVSGAAVLSSLAFMSHHVLVVGELAGGYALSTWLFASAVAGAGLVWAWQYHRSRSLYGPWLSHAMVDAALLWIGYGLWR